MTSTTLFLRSVLTLAALPCLAACGGGSAAAPATPPPAMAAPPEPPAEPATEAPDFSAVINEINRHPVEDMVLIVGDVTGPLFTREKDALGASDPVRLASASKLLSGLAVWSLVEDGTLAETDRVADRVVGWPAALPDITLSQLMAFTSGFNQTPADPTCAGRAARRLEGCVLEIARGGVDSPPGTLFGYGPEHLQIAALMAREASGEALSETLRRAVLSPSGASPAMGFRDYSNVRYAGGAGGSAADYAAVLRAVLDGDLVSDRAGFLRDRTAGVGTAPGSVQERQSRDWHYGFGFWIECDSVPFDTACTTRPTISSPSAFGTVPWIDFDAGYWAVIAMEERDPAVSSVALQQTLQPLIEAALAD